MSKLNEYNSHFKFNENEYSILHEIKIFTEHKNVRKCGEKFEELRQQFNTKQNNIKYEIFWSKHNPNKAYANYAKRTKFYILSSNVYDNQKSWDLLNKYTQLIQYQSISHIEMKNFIEHEINMKQNKPNKTPSNPISSSNLTDVSKLMNIALDDTKSQHKPSLSQRISINFNQAKSILQNNSNNNGNNNSNNNINKHRRTDSMDSEYSSSFSQASVYSRNNKANYSNNSISSYDENGYIYAGLPMPINNDDDDEFEITKNKLLKLSENNGNNNSKSSSSMSQSIANSNNDFNTNGPGYIFRIINHYNEENLSNNMALRTIIQCCQESNSGIHARKYTLFDFEKYFGLLFFKCCPDWFSQKSRAGKIEYPWNELVNRNKINDNYNNSKVSPKTDANIDLNIITGNIGDKTPSQAPLQSIDEASFSSHQSAYDELEVDDEKKSETNIQPDTSITLIERKSVVSQTCCYYFNRIVNGLDDDFPNDINMFEVIMLLMMIHKSEIKHIDIKFRRSKLSHFHYLFSKLGKHLLNNMDDWNYHNLHEKLQTIWYYSLPKWIKNSKYSKQLYFDTNKELFGYALDILNNNDIPFVTKKEPLLTFLSKSHWIVYNKKKDKIEESLKNELNIINNEFKIIYNELNRNKLFHQLNDVLKEPINGRVFWRQDDKEAFSNIWFKTDVNSINWSYLHKITQNITALNAEILEIKNEYQKPIHNQTLPKQSATKILRHDSYNQNISIAYHSNNIHNNNGHSKRSNNINYNSNEAFIAKIMIAIAKSLKNEFFRICKHVFNDNNPNCDNIQIFDLPMKRWSNNGYNIMEEISDVKYFQKNAPKKPVSLSFCNYLTCVIVFDDIKTLIKGFKNLRDKYSDKIIRNNSNDKKLPYIKICSIHNFINIDNNKYKLNTKAKILENYRYISMNVVIKHPLSSKIKMICNLQLTLKNIIKKLGYKQFIIDSYSKILSKNDTEKIVKDLEFKNRFQIIKQYANNSNESEHRPYFDYDWKKNYKMLDSIKQKSMIKYIISTNNTNNNDVNTILSQ